MASPTPHSIRLADDNAKGIRTASKVSLASLLDGQAHPALVNVTCDLSGSKLTLEGDVPTFYLKQLAQEAAVRVQGVEKVENRIEVRPAHVAGR